MKKKELKNNKNRIISILLAFGLVVSAAYSVPLKGGVSAESISQTGGTLSLYPNNNVSGSFTFVNDGNGLGVKYVDWSLNEVTTGVESGSNVEINTNGTGSAYVYIDCDATLGTISFSTNETMATATLTINSGASLTASAFNATGNVGNVTNNGTLVMSTFDTDVLKNQPDGYFHLTNNGTVSATNMTFNSDAPVSSSAGSVYRVTNSFTKDDFDLAGTVVVDETTSIQSSGGSFTIQVGEAKKTITEAVPAGTTAVDLLDSPEVFLEEFDEDVYYGVNYDYTSKISCAPGYGGTPYLEYMNANLIASDWTTEKPTYIGNYRVRAVAPAYGSYKAEISMMESEFSIVQFPFSEVPKASGDKYVTLEGVKNEIYVADKVTLVPNSAFQISASLGDSLFHDKLALARSDLYLDDGDYFNEDTMVFFKRKSDGAQTTETRTFYNTIPELMDLVFDRVDPEVSNSVVLDDKAATLSSGGVVEGKKVVFTVSDEYLDKAVVTVGSTSTTEKFEAEATTGTVEVKGTRGKTEDVSVTAYDLAGRSKTFSFKLKYPTVVPEASIKIFDTYVGKNYIPVVDSESDGKDRATFEYKKSGADDSTYTTEKPTKAGSYTVRATIPATDAYESVTCTADFTINKNVVESAAVKARNVYLGQKLDFEVESDSDGNQDAKFLYKTAGAPDSTYTTDEPSTIGNYVVQAIIPETEAYKSTSCISEFEVSFLEAPKNAYSLSGQPGKNKYYVSDVNINPAEGYTISSKLQGAYSNRILYTGKNQKVYLKRKSDGALTNAINVTEDYKIDKEAPTISQSDNSKVYSDELSVEISDDHLHTFVIDGESFTVTKSSTTAKLDPMNGVKTFNLKAEDEAGNTSSAAITVMATWLKDKIIPAGKLLPLDSTESYKLGSGKWTVSGDSTVYNGGGSVYVNSDGDYTFTQVD